MKLAGNLVIPHLIGLEDAVREEGELDAHVGVHHDQHDRAHDGDEHHLRRLGLSQIKGE